jgi:aminoglycoside phosphotransferase family enzyme/predicted kinase
MIPPQTQQVLDFLGDPASYSHHPATVTLHQTHASWVFVASPYVYKIKKPVDFGFMDFTTLEKRKANCEREVTLNRRLTEDIYLGVEAISLRDGKLQFGESSTNSGEIVEWAVQMREMDARDFLSHRIREKRFDPSDLDRVIERLVEFYKKQPPLEPAKAQAAVAQMPKNIAANYKIARSLIHIPGCVTKAAIDLIEHFTQTFEANHAQLLASRTNAGMIRDCHGDLHLEHIHLSQSAINIYDCIEFNTEFREIDVASDIAFLAMDLDFNTRSAEARSLIGKIAKALADPDLPLLANYYKCYRACVRGKVEMLRAAEQMVEKPDEVINTLTAYTYFHLALRYALTGFAPIAFVVMGKVGCGKSTLASALLGVTSFPTFSSDLTRKLLAEVNPTTRGTREERQSLYSEEMTNRVYDDLAKYALKRLNQGQCVIVDATFSRRSCRDDFNSRLKAAGFEVCWIEATAEPETIRARLKSREDKAGVISDAREEDQAMLNSLYEPPTEIAPQNFITQPTDQAEETTLAALLKEISRRYSGSMTS